MFHFVVPFDGLVQVLCLQHVDDGRECFFVYDRCIVWQIGDDGWFDEEAGAIDGFAAHLDTATLLDGLGNGGVIVLNGRLIVQRSVQGGRLQRMANAFC